MIKFDFFNNKYNIKKNQMVLLLGHHISLSSFSRTKRLTEGINFTNKNNFQTLQIFTKSRIAIDSKITFTENDILSHTRNTTIMIAIAVIT